MNVPNKFHLVWDGVDGKMKERARTTRSLGRVGKGKREAQIRLIRAQAETCSDLDLSVFATILTRDTLHRATSSLNCPSLHSRVGTTRHCFTSYCFRCGRSRQREELRNETNIPYRSSNASVPINEPVTRKKYHVLCIVPFRYSCVTFSITGPAIYFLVTRRCPSDVPAARNTGLWGSPINTRS
jgi:hypothetical protein